VQVPALGAEIVAVIVDNTVVLPTSLTLSFTEPPVKFTGAQVVLSSMSKVAPEAAVLLSFRLKVSSGSVSPTTNFIVSEYAIINYTYNGE
jgi:hypothetical protein